MNESGRKLLENVGQAFQLFRAETGLTQRQVAALGNSSCARISSLERGEGDPALTTIQRWASVYGYEVEISFVPIEE